MTNSLNETIGLIAQNVFEELGSGQTESVYQCAMEVGLRLAKLRYESQKVVEVKYRGHYVGRGAADLVVWSRNAKTVVELKSVDLGTPEQNRDDFLGTDETYPVKIGSVPISFDSLMGYFSSVPARPPRISCASRIVRWKMIPASFRSVFLADTGGFFWSFSVWRGGWMACGSLCPWRTHRHYNRGRKTRDGEACKQKTDFGRRWISIRL